MIGKIAYAKIPPKKLRISGVIENSVTTEPTAQVEVPVAPPSSAGEGTVARRNRVVLYSLVILCGLLIIAWLGTAILLVRIRGRLKELEGAGEEESVDLEREGKAFNILSNHCRSGNPNAARSALLNWASSLHPGQRIQTVMDLQRVFPGSRLTEIISEMDRKMYGPEEYSSDWQGGDLLQEVNSLRQKSKILESENRKTTLESLYR